MAATEQAQEPREQSQPAPPPAPSSPGVLARVASGLASNAAVGAALREVETLTKAARRVATLAAVDVAVALPPRLRPLGDAAVAAVAPPTTAIGGFTAYRPSAKPSALLVLCHPAGSESLCGAMAAVWEEELRRADVQYKRINLCEEQYVGLGSSSELRAALAQAGGKAPKEVERLQALVDEARFLVFVHPIYWFDVPSQLKGFLESVLSSGFAFRKLPSCWTLNRAVGVLERLPVIPGMLRRYSAYGFLRDKRVYITRSQGGPAAGLGVFGHGATTLASSLQFCGARVAAVDTVPEVDDHSREYFRDVALPRLRRDVSAHCSAMAALATEEAVDHESTKSGGLVSAASAVTAATAALAA
eukprot:TRINITY_DN6201_c0_g1_i1.p1 TRINITY_DN6201_c0_g1~~TRINITY_DN6201_c0_g1_i1.p1  ORF type:complete len:387 (-),score=73.71 TRINITY_DN6201_c0_g1_i1:205-1284(-)